MIRHTKLQILVSLKWFCLCKFVLPSTKKPVFMALTQLARSSSHGRHGRRKREQGGGGGGPFGFLYMILIK